MYIFNVQIISRLIIQTKYFFFAVIVLLAVLSCQREVKDEQTTTQPFPQCQPNPLLTSRSWLADTIIITPPAIYSQLSPQDQQLYKSSFAWFGQGRNRIVFRDDCSTSNLTGGDWDDNRRRWATIANDPNLFIEYSTNNIDTLLNWTVDNLHFTYQRRYSPNFSITYIYK